MAENDKRKAASEKSDKDEPEMLVETQEIAVGRTGFRVCLKLTPEQQRTISDLAGEEVSELLIHVDDLADLASVIAN